jgi:hypothetical protein
MDDGCQRFSEPTHYLSSSFGQVFTIVLSFPDDPVEAERVVKEWIWCHSLTSMNFEEHHLSK